MAPPIQRLVVGISGASGALYGVKFLHILRAAGIQSHLIVSRAAELTLAHETGLSLTQVKELADHWHDPEDLMAGPASGSFRTLGMVVAPCSIRTMSEIATGVTTSLLTRAADVTLKERRRLVLMVRETPLHTGHLATMLKLSEIGAIVAPPVPSLYTKPASIDEMVSQTVSRALDLFGIDSPAIKRWGE